MQNALKMLKSNKESNDGFDLDISALVTNNDKSPVAPQGVETPTER